MAWWAKKPRQIYWTACSIILDVHVIMINVFLVPRCWCSPCLLLLKKIEKAFFWLWQMVNCRRWEMIAPTFHRRHIFIMEIPLKSNYFRLRRKYVSNHFSLSLKDVGLIEWWMNSEGTKVNTLVPYGVCSALTKKKKFVSINQRISGFLKTQESILQTV